VGQRIARLRFEGKTAGLGLGAVATVADKLVGHKVRERVGGRIRYCISGGAPLGPKILEFFFAIGIPILEGYGLTETSPVICLTQPGRERPGAVGPPVPGTEVRFGPEGEIQVKGPGVMQGYFGTRPRARAPMAGSTPATWATGRRGFLRITDRLKDLLVTSGGKKVAPQPLEAKLKASRWVSEAVMLGDQRPYCVALIIPNFANLEAEAKLKGWPAGSRNELLRSPAARSLYQTLVDDVNAGLAPYETIKRFELLDRDLSAEAGELTPTLKVRRRIVTQTFADLIEGMYAGAAALHAG
jgi:long-chain acyl-CoA synthetase